MHTNVQKITPTIDVGNKKTEIEVVTASPGENVMFTCQIPKEASDQLVFQWLHDGKIIQQGPKKVIFLYFYVTDMKIGNFVTVALCSRNFENVRF